MFVDLCIENHLAMKHLLGCRHPVRYHMKVMEGGDADTVSDIWCSVWNMLIPQINVHDPECETDLGNCQIKQQQLQFRCEIMECTQLEN